MEKQPQTQVFKSVVDFLRLDDETFDRMLIDLKKWHQFSRGVLSMADAVNSAAKKDNPNAEDVMQVTFEKFSWVDDGKNDLLGITIDVTGKNADGSTERKIIRVDVEDDQDK